MIIQIMAGVFLAAMVSMVQADTINLYETDFEHGLDATLIKKGLTDTWTLSEQPDYDNQKMLTEFFGGTEHFLRGGRQYKDKYSIHDPEGAHLKGELDEATLTLTGLNSVLGSDARDLVLTFDFYVLGSWDGKGSGKYNADYFQVNAGSDTQWASNNEWAVKNHYGQWGKLDETFSGNNPVFNTDYFQCDPNWGGGDIMDTLYKDFSINLSGHTGDTLTITFTGKDLQKKIDESWGVDNVRVSAVSAPSSAVPEPGTFMLAAMGLLGLAGVMRKRNS